MFLNRFAVTHPGPVYSLSPPNKTRIFMHKAPGEISAKSYIGLFFLTLSTLMFQVLLTRIFSVTMWYHFAFMAISIAMFGMTVGALIVYIAPTKFPAEKATTQLAAASLLFTVFAILGFLVHVYLPFRPLPTLKGLASVMITYSAISVPFIFSGVAVTIALTRFPARVSSLYAVDLVGASLGCVAIALLFEIMDGPTLVFFTAAVIAVAAAFFSWDARKFFLLGVSALMIAGLLGYCVVAKRAADDQHPILDINYVKGERAAPNYYQKWNAYSNIKVLGDPKELKGPLGWGISETYNGGARLPQLHMIIDSSAGTILTGWDGKTLSDIDYLRYDVTNLAHRLRPNADTLVVGVGGGRDILSALVFGAKSVTGVEINHVIVGMLKGRFADFTGHLNDNPKVHLINDEARSYMARTKDRFDIFQVSLIDTWAATAAGAFVLTENGLYTREGWDLFLSRLKPNGVLSYSRWYYKPKPAEAWRLVGLAAETLKARGVKNPREHVLAAATTFRWDALETAGSDRYVITALVSNEPFSAEDVATFEAACKELNFTVVVTPETTVDDTFAAILTPGDSTEFYRNFELNIAPPTDDNAFFFHMIRFRDLLNRQLLSQSLLEFNNKALTILALLLATVTILTVLCIFVPLVLTTKRAALAGAGGHFLYFGGIGAGFMIIEISQMQRLNIFLGHPIYSLAVVLFALLLSSGLGSFTTNGITAENLPRKGAMRMGLLLAVLALFGLVTPTVIHAFAAASTPARLLIAVLIVFPIGLFMGMAFPIGMKAAARAGRAGLTPWLWGINGALSVFASVLSMCIAIFAGVTAAFWVGFACYVIVAIAFWRNQRSAGYGG
ncbi:hypothetical protein BH09SUM1_BH09SUM1_30030 [soil metagenome]